MRYFPEEPEPVPVVDAHHHLWDLSRGRYPWLQEGYDPRKFFLGGHQALRSDFLPAHYRQASQGCRVLATVHVEARRAECEQLDETAWLHELHQHHGMPNAVVPCLDLAHPAAEERLHAQLHYPLVRGVRCAVRGARCALGVAGARCWPCSAPNAACSAATSLSPACASALQRWPRACCACCATWRRTSATP